MSTEAAGLAAGLTPGKLHYSFEAAFEGSRKGEISLVRPYHAGRDLQSEPVAKVEVFVGAARAFLRFKKSEQVLDRKSTRLNSSHP